MVRDGVLRYFVRPRETPKPVNGFGRVVICPNLNSLRKVNCVIDY